MKFILKLYIFLVVVSIGLFLGWYIQNRYGFNFESIIYWFIGITVYLIIGSFGGYLMYWIDTRL